MLNEIPNFLYELLIKQYGEKLTNSIIEGYSTKRPLTIRINKIKGNGQILRGKNHEF